MMNRFKYISSRGPWCQLKRLQSSSSNSTVQIPSRIERGPTDILKALESTIPEDPITTNYIYHDDPFLLPMKKQNCRQFALSYESGKKTAMWIHKQHGILFPKHLSEPPIEAFKPPVTYTWKKQVSETILLQAISEYRLSDAIRIYELLETNVSNAAKQALLELLCFHSDKKIASKELPIEQWYSKPHKPVWQPDKHVDELYKFLIKQDPETAVLAHNAMLCGLAKYFRADETWILYEKCDKDNIPLNVTTYNYIIMMLTEIFSRKNTNKLELVCNILNSMNKKGVKPNVKTLNAVLKVVNKLSSNIAIGFMKHLCKEFNELNIKFSLATYFYIIGILTLNGNKMYNNFMDVLHTVSKESFTMQDLADIKFFPYAMYCAVHVYKDRKAGDMIHKIFCTGDNYKFIADNVSENGYYNSYMTLLVVTSTPHEFFEFYEKYVPNVYIPSIRLLTKIMNELKYHDREAIVKYVARIWSDINEFGYDDLSLKIGVISLMDVDSLPADSPLRSVFVNAAWSCWKDIKEEIQSKPETYNPIETAMIGYIVMLLLCDNCIDKSMEVLTYTIEQSHLFLPTITAEQLMKLFETFVLKQCIPGAFLILEYTENFGFLQITEMAKKLYEVPELSSADQQRLISLVGEEALNGSDTPKSS